MFELGCYAGESTGIFISQLFLKKINCVDPWEKNHKYKADDINDAEKRFDEYIGNSPLLTKHKTHSVDPIFNNQKVDFVYIDADHSYESVKRDILFWKDKTKVIAGHDYEMPKQDGVKKAVDEIFGKPDMVFEDYSWLKFL
jgi:hypothetical protein